MLNGEEKGGKHTKGEERKSFGKGSLCWKRKEHLFDPTGMLFAGDERRVKER